MAVATVSSTQAFVNAIQFAADGDIIKLAPGSYSNILIRDAVFSKGITITSADPKRPAVITDILVMNSNGLKFTDMNFTNSTSRDLAFRFMNSDNLTLDNLNISGTASAMNARLLQIRDSNNIQVTDSEFSYGRHGLSLLNTKSATVQDNYFHDLRTDGIRGGGNSDLTIRGNVLTDFRPAANDHPDAIQLWTNNTSTSASNILIDNNVILRGNGGPTQGIFMRDISGSTPFLNVVVTDNVVVGGRYNGIAISGVKNGFLGDNIIQSFPDQASGIRMQASTGVVVQGNEASQYYAGIKPMLGQNGNVMIASAKDQGTGIINHWLSQHPEFASAWQTTDPTVLTLLKGNGLAVPPVSVGSPSPVKPRPDTDGGSRPVDDDGIRAPANNDDDAGRARFDDDGAYGGIPLLSRYALQAAMARALDRDADGDADGDRGAGSGLPHRIDAFRARDYEVDVDDSDTADFEAGLDRILASKFRFDPSLAEIQNLGFGGQSGFEKSGEPNPFSKATGTKVFADDDSLADLEIFSRVVHLSHIKDFML